jgi:CheY-like chemotaxis protein
MPAPAPGNSRADPVPRLVDDESSIITITGQTLKAFGYRVLTATDGAEALAVYAKHEDEIAVVLTDMMMPVLDRAAMIRALVRINPFIKIIAASGLNANGSITKFSDPKIRQFGFEALGGSAVRFLGRRRELHHGIGKASQAQRGDPR